MDVLALVGRTDRAPNTVGINFFPGKMEPSPWLPGGLENKVHKPEHPHLLACSLAVWGGSVLGTHTFWQAASPSRGSVSAVWWN